jgi:sugar phosphate isomerase/epimerase
MWQDMDVIEVIRCLGREEAIYHVHAKDTCSGITKNTWDVSHLLEPFTS